MSGLPRTLICIVQAGLAGHGQAGPASGRVRAARHLITAGGVLAVTATVVLTGGPALASPLPPAQLPGWQAPGWQLPGSQAPTLWVSASASPSGTDVSCQSAAYSTIQAAVTAAEATTAKHPGQVPVVDICPGTYSEQLTIADSVQLTRAPVPASLGSVTIELPAAVGSDQSLGLSTTSCQANDSANSIQIPQSVIEVCGTTKSVQVTVNNLTVEGDWPSNVCNDSLYDILVGGGASLALTDSTVERAGAYPLNGCQGGVGVEVGFSPTGQVGHATLRDDTVETYQKNGIAIDGAGSTADISGTTVTGAGATPAIAQNGIQISFGATASVTHSTVTGDNYTGGGKTSAAGILVFGGGGSACGIGAGSPLVRNAVINGNRLSDDDIGVALYNLNAACNASADSPTRVTVCYNDIQNANGYPSADANSTGFGTSTVGYQAGISDTGDRDFICGNSISGAGYAPQGTTSSLPSPPPPAFVRPIDMVTGPAIAPLVMGNTYDGRLYVP